MSYAVVGFICFILGVGFAELWTIGLVWTAADQIARYGAAVRMLRTARRAGTERSWDSLDRNIH